ncbi:MAG TPA: cell wall hydrolase [Rhizomicrobium sp.]|nr:cell wall hydrolase [Rhizomicrobium sp.]
MRISRRNWERLGDVLAVVVATLLAGVIVALAQTAQNMPAPAPPQPAQIDLKQSRPLHPVVIPAPIAPAANAEDALKRIAAEENCLAQVIYFEARGESEAGQRAVAEVILNRLAEGTHGKTICGVVYEGVGQTFCQFTFACDGAAMAPKSAEPWRAAQVLAARLMVGEVPADAISGATYYHAVSVHPSWAPGKLRVTQIGNHIFYRDRGVQIRAVFRGSVQ